MKAYFSGNPHQEPEPDSVDNEPEQVDLDKVDETTTSSSSETPIQKENVIESNVMIKRVLFFQLSFSV